MLSLRGVLAAFAAALITLNSAAVTAACTGDCDGSGTCTVDEIVVGLSIALGGREIGDCGAFDADASGTVTVDEIVTAVSNALNGCPPMEPTPIFPANYRDTYTEVRDCRFSIEHGGVSIRVVANDIGAQPYLNEENPLPVGSIVIKEEYAGTTCDDEEDLIRWRVMGKESPGFDPEDGDWHWQWVETDRTVTFDDKSTCIGCHVSPECLSRDYMCTEGGDEARLTAVLTRLPAALLSIAGRGPNEMYAVGGDPGDGFGPFVLYYDGSVWRRLNTGASGDLWWISVTPIDGDFYLAGGGGLVLRFDPDARTFEQIPTPGTEVLFGIWGASANDLWVVGGDDEFPDVGGVLWHYNGTSWTVYDTTTIRPGGVPRLFKVWGRSADEIYAVGLRGITLRYNGQAWTELTNSSMRPLFTVHGNDNLVAASGGFVDGVILELEGDQFVQRPSDNVQQMNGIFIPPSGDGVAVGITGDIARRLGGVWEEGGDGLDTPLDFHAAWIDGEGGIWAVGGDLSLALSEGMVAYAGTRQIGSDVIDIPVCPPGQANPNATISYANDILPLFLREGCLAAECHGGGFPASGYDLRSYETSFGQGIEARIFGLCDIVPGDPDSSYLIEKIGPSPRFGERMPNMRPPLEEEDIALIREWILEGAPDDRPATPTATFTVRVVATPTQTRSTTQAAVTPTPTRLPTLSPACDVAGNICTIAGTGQAQFNGDGREARATSFYYPIDVLFAPDGNLLILDWNNLRVRRLNDDDTISTIMGKDLEDFPTDGALAKDTPLHHASDIEFDAEGRMYVAGDHVPVVFRVGTNDRVFTIAGTAEYGYDGDGGSALACKLETPFGVLPRADGGFYIADVDAHVVRLVDTSGIIDTIAGTGERGYSGDNGPATQARLAGPSRMALDDDGNLYVCETKNHVVRRIAPDGTITTAFGTGQRGYAGDGGPAGAAQLDTPYDVTFAPNGDAYISDTGNNVIRRVDASGTISTVVGIGIAGFGGDGGDRRSALLNRPSAVTFDDSGAMWIADTSNQRVRRVAGFLGLQP